MPFFDFMGTFDGTFCETCAVKKEEASEPETAPEPETETTVEETTTEETTAEKTTAEAEKESRPEGSAAEETTAEAETEPEVPAGPGETTVPEGTPESTEPETEPETEPVTENYTEPTYDVNKLPTLVDSTQVAEELPTAIGADEDGGVSFVGGVVCWIAVIISACVIIAFLLSTKVKGKNMGKFKRYQ